MKPQVTALLTALALVATSAAVAQNKGGGKSAGEVQGIVVDANGKTVGRYAYPIPFTSSPRVMATLNGRLTTFALEAYIPQGASDYSDVTKMMPGPGIESIYFESPDCSGQGYIPATYTPGVHPSASVHGPDGSVTAVYVGAATPRVRVTVASEIYRGWVAACRLKSPVQVMNDLAPVVDAVPLPSLFAAPYVVR